MNDLAAALAQSRMPQGGVPSEPMPQMPPMPAPQGGAVGPADGAVFRQAMNIAAAELGPNAPQQAVEALAARILQMSGVAPAQGAPMQPGMPQGAPMGMAQASPQGGAPMGQPQMPMGGMPPRGM